MKMISNLWLFSLIFTTCSACVFGFNNKDNISKRSQSQTPWHEERLSHNGLGLSDVDLQKVASLNDEKHFNDTLTNILIPRVPDTPGIAKVQQFIVNQMENLGWTVENHSFEDQTPLGMKKFTNIIATLNPAATRRLVIVCHYDSKMEPEGFLGACDSAVPCAMMINLAQTMRGPLSQQQNGPKSDVTLQLIFMDGEEAFLQWSSTDSLYGAKKLASKLKATTFPPGHLTNELHRMDLFVLLDLIGPAETRFYSYFPESERWYSRLSSFEKRFVQLGMMKERTSMFREQSYYGAGIEDDHIPFLKNGVPVLHLISFPFPTVWHTMSDNRDAISPSIVQNMNTLLRVLAIDYLHLNL